MFGILFSGTKINRNYPSCSQLLKKLGVRATFSKDELAAWVPVIQFTYGNYAHHTGFFLK